MSRKIDITGERYGRLVAIKCIGARNGSTIWLFKCDCGNEKEARLHDVRSSKTRSCGCLSSEKTTHMKTKHGFACTGNKGRLYNIWHNMLQRCKAIYGCYGNVKVCDEWKDYTVFHNWAMSNGYSDAFTIDRINNDGNYEPGNCRWTTVREQNRNKHNNIHLEYDGIAKLLVEWAEELGIKVTTLRDRFYSGWDDERILTEKLKTHNLRGGVK